MRNAMPAGYRAMVTSPHYLASSVGSSILEQGGSAYDASVAVSAALGVVYPHMTGLGGDAFFLIFDAASGKVEGLNGSGRAGREASIDAYSRRGLFSIPHRGPLSAVTVPGMADAWWEVWQRGGRLPWAAVLEPARRYAEEGFPVSRDLHRWMVRDESWLRQDAGLCSLFLHQGRLLREGERLVQPDLAAALRTLQTEGRDAFYTGSLMKGMTEGLQRDGGLLVPEDFAAHRSTWVEPVRTTYRGYDVLQMPPNSQGFSVLMMLNMLEAIGLSGISRNTAEFYHLAAEVVKRAFRDRDRYLTDPAFSAIPLERLLSKEYARMLAADLDPPAAAPYLSPASGQDTAYAAVVDEAGNAVSFIQSLYFDFGSAYMPQGTGIILQNRGSFFSLEETHVNALQPGKRTFHTLMPGMMLKDGVPALLMGTQGGEGQPQTTLSLITGVVDYGCTIQEAVDLPRWVYGRTWGEDSDMLRIEDRGLGAAAERLQAWGHQVQLFPAWDGIMGQAQGIRIDPGGLRTGAADPRGDGAAIGW
ncbi:MULTISPECIES: gamma-glutamyltransferase [Paenibacillus]|uniref:gamma-glutamyltransferase n=1 Tax=Paenibacillus TaxID=44249 RepID=UPI0022B85F8C|nr:gamma-glutamyltransferase [Paenibacillus caseinilyticus]MCZ8521730.1 gamma-glutamyltransferase [Paenibacillus caseinilyticus]